MPDTQKKSRRGLQIFGVVIALLVGALLVLPWIIDANQFRPRLESQFTAALNRKVQIGNLRVSLLSGGVAADEIVIADNPEFSREPFVHAKSLRVGVEWKPLIFSRAVRITGITLEQPEITLIRSASGEWNFSSIGQKAGAQPKGKSGPSTDADISVQELSVTRGKISVFRGIGSNRPLVYENVNLSARNLSLSSIFPVSLTATLPAGGTVKLEGQGGPLNHGDASLTPITTSLAVTQLDLLASGFIEPDSGLAGLVDFDGKIVSDGMRLRSRGRATADKFRIVKGGSGAGRAVTLEYSIEHDLKNQSGTINSAKVMIGKATAIVNGSYRMNPQTTVLKMKLQGKDMPAEDLEALLPAVGVSLPKGAAIQGGTLASDFLIDGPIENLVISGSLSLANTRLTGFDLGTKMRAVSSIAGIKSSSVTEIEKFASGLRVTREGIQASGLSLIVPALGELTGDGTVGSDASLNFKMFARLKTSGGVLASLGRFSGAQAGSPLGVPFFIRGTTSAPSFVPDVQGLAGSVLGSALEGKSGQDGGSAKPSLGDTLRQLIQKKKN